MCAHAQLETQRIELEKKRLELEEQHLCAAFCSRAPHATLAADASTRPFDFVPVPRLLRARAFVRACLRLPDEPALAARGSDSCDPWQPSRARVGPGRLPLSGSTHFARHHSVGACSGRVGWTATPLAKLNARLCHVRSNCNGNGASWMINAGGALALTPSPPCEHTHAHTREQSRLHRLLCLCALCVRPSVCVCTCASACV
jgi:hypothetical protein